jgi:hypothetical protein
MNGQFLPSFNEVLNDSIDRMGRKDKPSDYKKPEKDIRKAPIKKSAYKKSLIEKKVPNKK